ncbi:MAG: 16S rRNA processing protein RimM [Chloroflexi bacterium]|nr:16S rRNA processing protein RimM [Chloroflexota bacterium]
MRGELKCRIVTDFPQQRFRRGNTVLIAAAPYSIVGARIQGQTVLLRLAEISDRNVAETLRGKEVTVRREDALKLPAGEFYWHEVIGLSVVDATTQQMLGTVADILETGANDVYVVRTPAGKELLVPAIKDVVKSIDPTTGHMVIEPLAGMLPP